MIIIASNVIIVACLIVASVLTFDFGKPSLTAVTIFLYEIFKKNFMAPFFMDGVQSDDLAFKVMTSHDILFLNNESNEKYLLFKLV